MQVPAMPEPTTTLPLRDIKLPAEPGYWPLAPGWWVLIALILVLCSWLLWKYLRYRRRQKRWQAIQQQLTQIQFDYAQHQQDQQLLAELSVFLRRFVKFQLGDPKATTLQGDAWIDYLNQFKPAGSFKPYAEALSSGVYQSNHRYDAQGLLSATEQLVRQQVMKPPKQQPQQNQGGQHV